MASTEGTSFRKSQLASEDVIPEAGEDELYPPLQNAIESAPEIDAYSIVRHLKNLRLMCS
jgi:hypothetical protein